MTIEQYKARNLREHGGFVTAENMAEVVRLDPGCLMRLRFGHHAAMAVPARDVALTIQRIESGGADWCRFVEFAIEK